MFLAINKPVNPIQFAVASVIACPGPGTTEFSILVSDKNYIPVTWLEKDETAILAVARLVNTITGVTIKTGSGTSGFEDATLVALQDNPLNKIDETGDRVIYAIYGCVFPERPKVSEDYGWILFTELIRESPELATIVSEALRKL